MKKIAFLTGSGISKAAGIPTFRGGEDGWWENYDVQEVCTAGCLERDPEKAYGFYSYIHGKYKNLSPTKAHRMIAALEDDFEVTVVTQNVDDLHEKAGSTNVIHLHGELSKIQAVDDPRWIRPWGPDVVMHEDTIIEGHHIRPFIVMFGEDVPEMGRAQEAIRESDILVVIGTSLVVYPAAGLIEDAKEVVYIDPSPSIYAESFARVIKGTAEEGLKIWIQDIKL